MRNWTPNQKLTKEQIQTIKYLKANGVALSLIAQVIHKKYGVSVSTAYYHASDNREAYCYQVKKIRQAQRLKTKELIRGMIQEGLNTKQIADQWNMELSTVNKIYAT